MAKFIRVLEQAGMSDDEFQRVIDDPAIRFQVVRVLQTSSFVLPGHVPNELTQRMLGSVLNWRRPEDKYIIDYYADWAVLKPFVEKLTKRQQEVLVLLHGLGHPHGRKEYVNDIARHMNVSTTRVRQLIYAGQKTLVLQLYRHYFTTHGELAEADSVDNTSLSSSTATRLKSAGIHTVDELCSRTEDELLRINFFGQKRLDEVLDVLAELGKELRKE